MMHQKYILCLIMLLSASQLKAQYPSTDIWIFDLDLSMTVEKTISNPYNITNRSGYDNQPSFSPDSKYIYYSSVRDSIQSDIFRFDIKRKETKQITSTIESEYSPTITPDGMFMTVVRVDTDTTQKLYKQFPDGKKPLVLLTTSDTVGYHTWLNQNLIAIFALGEPHTLRIANIRDQRTTIIAENIGRCISKIPGKESLSYVDKTDSTKWKIMSFDLATQFAKPVIETLGSAEDYVWTNEGLILMGSEGLLFSCNAFDKSPVWKVVGDLRRTDAENFYRIALNPEGNKIALVVHRLEK